MNFVVIFEENASALLFPIRMSSWLWMSDKKAKLTKIIFIILCNIIFIIPSGYIGSPSRDQTITHSKPQFPSAQYIHYIFFYIACQINMCLVNGVPLRRLLRRV